MPAPIATYATKATEYKLLLRHTQQKQLSINSYCSLLPKKAIATASTEQVVWHGKFFDVDSSKFYRKIMV
ncbi:hypothetical protein [Okeania sp. SIO2B3]|uniref:hypothetical protein n=1 Tax=Okeania sp. SIO2B3 TaxID=2607784 RepID=UPI0013C06CA7|nr:hypothetical protein [Okeania sp. SIO2B3]NET46567.1 hypothetical protein [Okeania sp. SIO2B3]